MKEKDGKVYTDEEIDSQLEFKSKKEQDILDNLPKDAGKLHSRLEFSPFFASLFKTFGLTLVVFMVIVFLLFLIMWFKGG